MAATTSQRAHLNDRFAEEDDTGEEEGDDEFEADDAAADEVDAEDDGGDEGKSLSPFSSSLVVECRHMTCSAREWLWLLQEKPSPKNL